MKEATARSSCTAVTSAQSLQTRALRIDSNALMMLQLSQPDHSSVSAPSMAAFIFTLRPSVPALSFIVTHSTIGLLFLIRTR